MNLNEMELFIKQIKSVLSCKIVTDKENEILEIHVLSDTKRGPKQISRDVQSGLISKFGIEVDHKKISIAQIDERSMDDKDYRLKLKTIEFSSTGTRADVKVILEKEGKLFEGEVSGVNTSNNSQRLLATATLKAIENFLGVDDNFILEDIKITTLAGREAVITAITFMSVYNEQSFVGCAFASRDKKEAIVKSTLDAINRRVIKASEEK